MGYACAQRGAGVPGSRAVVVGVGWKLCVGVRKAQVGGDPRWRRLVQHSEQEAVGAE